MSNEYLQLVKDKYYKDIKEYFQFIEANYSMHVIKYIACVGNFDCQKFTIKIYYILSNSEGEKYCYHTFNTNFVCDIINKEIPLDEQLNDFRKFTKFLVDEFFNDKTANKFICFQNYKNPKSALICKDEYITSWIDKDYFFLNKYINFSAELVTTRNGQPTTFLSCIFTTLDGQHIISVIGHITEEIMDLLPDDTISTIFSYYKEEEEYIKRTKNLIASFRESIGEKYRLLYETKT